MALTLDPRLTPARPDLAARHLEGRVEAERFVDATVCEVFDPQAPVRRAPVPDAPLETEALKGERVSVQGSNPHIITDAGPAFSVWAQAIHDPSLEGIRHRDHPALGLAWRPDLPAKLQSRDLALIKGHFADPSGRSR